MNFDQLSERASRLVARPWFFVVVLVSLVAWVPTLFLADVGTSDLVVDALTNPLSLLLLVLLQNAQSRTDRAADDRQDNLERALALLLRHAADGEEDASRRDELRRQADHLVAAAAAASTLASAGVEE